MYTAELLVSDSSPFPVEIATAKMKRYKSPGGDVYKPIHSIRIMEESPD
jgi:hypothetical protein